MSVQLTNEQIDALFAFTRKKYVHWYDVQVEIVDHLATSIEEEMNNDSSLSFERALNRVYDRFGIFGFSKIVQEKEKAMGKHYTKLWLKELVNQLNWPNVVRSLAVAALLFTSSKFTGITLTMWLAVAAIAVISFISVRSLRKHRLVKNNELKMGNKTPLLMLQFMPVQWLFFFTYFPFITSSRIMWDFTIQLSRTQSLIMLLILWLVFLIALSAWSLTKTMLQQAKEKYPAAFAAD